METSLVGFIELYAFKELSNEFCSVHIPDGGAAILVDVLLAAGNHLIGNLHKERSHSLRGIIVTRNADNVSQLYAARRGTRSPINHLDSIDQAGNRGYHADRVTSVKGITESFQCIQIFYIVL